MWKVLIVDDVESTLTLLSGILRNHADCICADNARTALREFVTAMDKGAPFDCVMVDYDMPETDGLHLIDDIRKDEERRGIELKSGVPVIMVTSHPQVFMKSFRQGADDFLLKPVRADAVLTKVKEIIAKPRPRA